MTDLVKMVARLLQDEDDTFRAGGPLDPAYLESARGIVTAVLAKLDKPALTAEETKLVKAWRRLGVGTAGRYLLLRFPDDAFQFVIQQGPARGEFIGHHEDRG